MDDRQQEKTYCQMAAEYVARGESIPPGIAKLAIEEDPEAIKFSQSPDSWKADRDAYLTGRWSQLANLQQIWAERVIRYAFLVNAGGAVAMLTFMGDRTSGLHNCKFNNETGAIGARSFTAFRA